jgi:LCP family protein required for cell wall assembly
VLAVGVATAAGASIYTIKHLESVISPHRVHTGSGCNGADCIPSVNPFCSKVCTFLVLGSDTRAGLSKSQQSQFGRPSKAKGQRSDTIIVVRVDQTQHRTVVLSIPRDLRVAIPGFGTNKINTAFSHGRDVVVRTVTGLTGMTINHYVEVNFAGFQQLVNVLGGVPICIPQPMTDPLAGLNLPRKGCYNLHGAQALAFVRARHVQGDIIPDFSRIARQQQFLRALFNKVLSVGAITRIPRFIGAAKDNLHYDDHLNLEDLQDLAHRLAAVGQADVIFRTLPATPITINAEDFVQLVQPEASTLLERIRDGRPLGQIGVEAAGTPISPADITVHVEDERSGGRAQAVVDYLKEAGFVVDLRAAGPGVAPDTIYWGNGFGKQPKVVQSYLVNMRVVRDDRLVRGAQVVVVVGPTYRQRGVRGL